MAQHGPKLCKRKSIFFTIFSNSTMRDWAKMGKVNKMLWKLKQGDNGSCVKINRTGYMCNVSSVGACSLEAVCRLGHARHCRRAQDFILGSSSFVFLVSIWSPAFLMVLLVVQAWSHLGLLLLVLERFFAFMFMSVFILWAELYLYVLVSLFLFVFVFVFAFVFVVWATPNDAVVSKGFIWGSSQLHESRSCCSCCQPSYTWAATKFLCIFVYLPKYKYMQIQWQCTHELVQDTQIQMKTQSLFWWSWKISLGPLDVRYQRWSLKSAVLVRRWEKCRAFLAVEQIGHYSQTSKTYSDSQAGP